MEDGVSINEQIILRRYTHLKRYRGFEQRGEGEPLLFSTPDKDLLRTSSSTIPPPTSPLPALRAVSPPVAAINPMSTQNDPINFGDSPIGQPLRDSYMSARGCTHPGTSKHRFKYSGFPSLRLPNGHPTQNPEEKKEAEVSLCYLAPGSSF